MARTLAGSRFVCKVDIIKKGRQVGVNAASADVNLAFIGVNLAFIDVNLAS